MRASIAFVLLLLAAQAAGKEVARKYIKLVGANDAACVSLGGQMRQVVNTHDGRAIEVSLERRMGETVQPGRVVDIARPDGKPIDLGCTRIVGGYAQEWVVIDAEFTRAMRR
ncbi:MAG: hypothetical protein ACR2KU_06155 [Gammaproteobacteria bacterium]|nr:hypothetical protein [Gammaproteobacteria bacterium]MBA3731895.1 hypothetical protein [Gammaproteobacteria bacterium]